MKLFSITKFGFCLVICLSLFSIEQAQAQQWWKKGKEMKNKTKKSKEKFDYSSLKLDSISLKEFVLVDKAIYVPSRLKPNGNLAELHRGMVQLYWPELKHSQYESEHIHSWAFAVAGTLEGTNENINPTYEPKQPNELSDYNVRGTLSQIGAFSLNLANTVRLPVSSESYRYYVMDYRNAHKFMLYEYATHLYSNTTTAGYKRFDNSRDWSQIHCITIDNINNNFNLNVKITAVGIIETRYYSEKSEAHQDDQNDH